MRTRRVLTLSVTAAVVALVAAGRTSGRAGGGPAISADPSRIDSAREAVARAYIDALISHDSSAVRFAPRATRVEAGLKTGFSGSQMTWDLAHGPQYRVIQGIRDLEMSESGDVVSTRYLLDAGIAGARLMTVEIVETFEVRDGSIHAIVARITPKSLGNSGS
ncbi:hypothetical protein [Rhodococcus tukisamuensis]|uniref:DUF8021 domain-containing protein n=1 Tax=Rhodococcus tukisamuensis TaxID=168276 RepID=A0A1G6WEM3_9NOCA|nr:hypothetical protein [Rhodococcus tukisamuensis]SDD64302.1 hypothetical protein SAMN05444580_105343 [Rhodococcus tukisamuensis]